MKILTDQLGKTHEFKTIPHRVISLVPSQTETLCDLGLKDSLVGITKFCIHPSHLKNEITIVGGTKNIHFNKIKALQPDLIICNKEENTKEIVETLSEICPVWITDIITIESNNQMISDFGKIFEIETKSKSIIDVINTKINYFNILHINKKINKVAYVIWKNPWMAVGRPTYINEILNLCKFESVFSHTEFSDSRYPEFDFENFKSLAVQYIFLSTEPFPFKQKDAEELQKLNGIKTLLVDGEMFSWHGSRLIKALDYFEKLHQNILE